MLPTDFHRISAKSFKNFVFFGHFLAKFRPFSATFSSDFDPPSHFYCIFIWQFFTKCKNSKFFEKFSSQIIVLKSKAWGPNILSLFLVHFWAIHKISLEKSNFFLKFQTFLGHFLPHFGQFLPNIEISAFFGTLGPKFRGRNFLKLHRPKKSNFGRFTKFRPSWQHCVRQTCKSR